VQAVVIDPETVEWIRGVLRESHQDERTYHEEQVAALERQCAAVQRKLDAAYEHLLERKISEHLWQRKSAEWRDQQVRLRAAIERHERANEVYFDEGFRILGLANRAYDLWLEQEAEERRKLLDILLSNCSFDGERLRATIDIGRPSRAFPVTPPCVRVRTRRFGPIQAAGGAGPARRSRR